jgi:A/G-specific adenine glycosylase
MDDGSQMDCLPADSWKKAFRRAVLAWFRGHARELPWRGTRDLYRVWVSEIMLQQTQVVTVVPYYRQFIERFPDVRALAAAGEQDVLRLWEGLGYYRRARQMHRAAQVIVRQHGGQFPQDVDAVRALPGIGRYTAGAILSIALDARLPILEANSVRVFCRLLAFRGDPSKSAAQRLLWRFAEELLPKKDVGTFNQALMELGSEICTPREPLCDRCPVARLCPTREQGLQELVPAAKKKTQYEEVHEAAVVIRRRGKVLVRRCGPDERWAGLWDFPRFPISARNGAALRRELAEKVADLTGVTIQPGEKLASIKHGVTRFRITLSCYAAEFLQSNNHRSNGNLKWLRPSELEGYPLSATGRKISRLLAPTRHD